MCKTLVFSLVFVSSIALLGALPLKCSEFNPPEKYALFICGVNSCSAGGVCPMEKDSLKAAGGQIWGFWADIVSFTNLLADEYCYESDHIYICWCDGDLPSLGGCSQYNLSVDLDSVNFCSATRESVFLAFDDIEARADSNDVLFVYINGHGDCYASGSGHAAVCLFDGYFTDYELGAFIDSVKCTDKTVVAQTCFCGGLVSEVVEAGGLILTANDYRVAYGIDDIGPDTDCDDPGGDAGDPEERTYCGGNKAVIHGEFAYHLLNALKSKTVDYQNPVNADRNDDGWITFDEAYAYACSTDSRGYCDGTAACYDTNLEAAQIGWPSGFSPSSMCLGGRINLASGPLCKNLTVWSDTVTVTGDVVIPVGDTLLVKPGTVVLCDSLDDRVSGLDTTEVEIIVQGTLSAIGTSQSPIKFTSRADPAQGQFGEFSNDIWRGIRFEPGSSGALDTLTVRRAYVAVDCDSASPSIARAFICDNQFAGIRCKGNAAPTIASGDSIASSYRGIVCKSTSAPTITDGVVIDTCGVGIEIRGSSTPSIRECRVKRCQKGIDAGGSSDPDILSGCEFYSNHSVGLYFNSAAASAIAVDSVKIRDNYAYGIRCDSGTMVTVSNCEIHGNDDGVAAFDSTECLLGRASPSSAGYNNLYNNTTCSVRNATTGGDTLYAENCWWGADPPDTSKICGLVDYEPYQSSEVQLALRSFPPGAEPDVDEIVSLSRVFPVPARGHVAIRYLVRSPGSKVRVSIVNVRGQEIQVLVDRWNVPGQYDLSWSPVLKDGTALPSGIYFCVLRSDNSIIETAKLVVVGGRLGSNPGGVR